MIFTKERLETLKQIVDNLPLPDIDTTCNLWTHCLCQSEKITVEMRIFLAMFLLHDLNPRDDATSPDQIMYKCFASGFLLGYQTRDTEITNAELERLGEL